MAIRKKRARKKNAEGAGPLPSLADRKAAEAAAPEPLSIAEQLFRIGQEFWGGQGGPRALERARDTILALRPSQADLHDFYAALPNPPAGSTTQQKVERLAHVVNRLTESAA